jgi:pimeloyl-ACP methyl ester carboxylesterase
MKERKLIIVALHGNGGGAFRFELVKPFIAREFDFRAITLPGFADVQSDPSLRSMRDYALYLRKIIDTMPRPLVLLGHGIGGSIILDLVQNFAESIDGIILHAPVGARLERRFFPRLMSLPGARESGRLLFSSRLTRPLFKRLLFRKAVPAEYLRRFFQEYRQCSVFSQMFDLINIDWFESLRPVSLPSALLWGERERILRVDQIEDYRRLLPESIVRIVPGWDHFPMIEEPEQYAAEISELASTIAEKKS